MFWRPTSARNAKALATSSNNGASSQCSQNNNRRAQSVLVRHVSLKHVKWVEEKATYISLVLNWNRVVGIAVYISLVPKWVGGVKRNGIDVSSSKVSDRSQREASLVSHFLNGVARVEGGENYISLVLKCVYSSRKKNALGFHRWNVCVIPVKRNIIYMWPLTLKLTIRLSVLLYHRLLLRRNGTCNAHVWGTRPGEKQSVVCYRFVVWLGSYGSVSLVITALHLATRMW